jgi:hypothetical protein
MAGAPDSGRPSRPGDLAPLLPSLSTPKMPMWPLWWWPQELQLLDGVDLPGRANRLRSLVALGDGWPKVTGIGQRAKSPPARRSCRSAGARSGQTPQQRKHSATSSSACTHGSTRVLVGPTRSSICHCSARVAAVELVRRGVPKMAQRCTCVEAQARSVWCHVLRQHANSPFRFGHGRH